MSAGKLSVVAHDVQDMSASKLSAENIVLSVVVFTHALPWRLSDVL